MTGVSFVVLTVMLFTADNHILRFFAMPKIHKKSVAKADGILFILDMLTKTFFTPKMLLYIVDTVFVF